MDVASSGASQSQTEQEASGSANQALLCSQIQYSLNNIFQWVLFSYYYPSLVVSVTDNHQSAPGSNPTASNMKLMV